MSNKLIQKNFDKLLIKFLIDEPFFSSIVRCMRKVQTTAIPTAGVSFVDDSITLYWNPKFVDELSSRQVFGLLKHECYHLIFKHLTLRKQDPHLLWNIATDLAINSTIPRVELPEGGLIPGVPMNLEKCKNVLPEKDYENAVKLSSFIESLPVGKSSEWYMEKLRDDEVAQMVEQHFNPKPGEGNPSGSSAGFDHHFDEALSDAEKQLADAKVSKIVKEAKDRADRSNAWGSTPSEMKERIRAFFENAVDWKSVLRYFCGTKQRANKTRTMRKINRKYPYIHAGRKTKHTSSIAIYIDQSGSVSEEGLALFFGALSQLSKKTKFTIYHFDAEVDNHSKYVWQKNKGFIEPYRTRGGGTDFDAVENHFRANSAEFDGYIVMTDGMAPKPKSCTSQRCWVLLPGESLYFEPEKRDTVVVMKNT